MLLRFPDGSSFATGASQYNNAPGTELASRIILDVVIGGQLTTAFADTGMPCSLCSPEFAAFLGLSSSDKASASLRGTEVSGTLHQVDISLIADMGDSLRLRVPVLVSEKTDEVLPDVKLRPYLGMQGCLGSINFGVDSIRQTFYFG
jgi:hypothetical protein